MNTPFALPFIRWADVAVLSERNTGVTQRRIYDHELVYVLSGHGLIQLENTAYPAAPGNLFFILPRCRHSFRAGAGEQLHLLGVHFDWVPQHDTLAFPIFTAADEPVDEGKFRVPTPIPGWDLQKQPFLELKNHVELQHMLENIVAEYTRYDEFSRAGAGALLASFILQLQRVLQTLNEKVQSSVVGADAVRRVQQARILLESQPENPLSVEEVAARVHWSGDHLRRMTRLVLHTSPSQLQLAARLRLARQLLRHEEASIAEIGQHCGFEDASHFTRVFKTHTAGLTPRQYVRMAKRI